MRRQAWQIRFIQLLAVPGLLVAFYLLLFHNGDLIAACGASGWDDCGRVSGPDAPYASVGPIPVALIGLAGYGVIFLLAWSNGWQSRLDRYLPELLVGVAGLAFILSLWLTGLELFVIRAVCRYCIVSAVLVTSIFGLSISYLRDV